MRRKQIEERKARAIAKKAQLLDLLTAVARGEDVIDVAPALKIAVSTAYRWIERAMARGELQPANDNRAPRNTPALSDGVLFGHILRIHLAHPDYGAPSIRSALAREGIRTSKKRVAKIMREHGISGAYSRKRKAHPMPFRPNLLKRDFSTDDINDVWVADTTQFKTADGWLYLAAVVDLHSRRIIGFAFGAVNDAKLTCAALRMAHMARNPAAGVWYHTDCGYPYVSKRHRKLIVKYGFVASNSAVGKCHDNAVMESCFSVLKRIIRKWLDKRTAPNMAHGKWIGKRTTAKMSRRDVIAMLRDVIHYYNHDRVHSALGYHSPVEFEALPLDTRHEIHARVACERAARKARRLQRIAARKARERVNETSAPRVEPTAPSVEPSLPRVEPTAPSVEPSLPRVEPTAPPIPLAA